MLLRRFMVEEVDNGWLVKVTEMGNDKLLGRFIFPNQELMLVWLNKKLNEKADREKV
jgi:hypothetical protein